MTRKPLLALAAVLLALAACGTEPEAAPREERWVGYGTGLHGPMADADSSDSKHYEFIFEYAGTGPYADDEFVALLTVDSGRTHRGDGFRAASETVERILVEVDTASFSGPVEDDTLWTAYMWLGDSIADSIVFVLAGIDGERPGEATDSVSGSGNQSVSFTLDEYGPHDCFADIVVGDDYDYVRIDFQDARNEDHIWWYERVDSGSFRASWSTTVGFEPNVERGEGRLEVDADSDTDWAVWCRKQ